MEFKELHLGGGLNLNGRAAHVLFEEGFFYKWSSDCGKQSEILEQCFSVFQAPFCGIVSSNVSEVIDA